MRSRNTITLRTTSRNCSTCPSINLGNNSAISSKQCQSTAASRKTSQKRPQIFKCHPTQNPKSNATKSTATTRQSEISQSSPNKNNISKIKSKTTGSQFTSDVGSGSSKPKDISFKKLSVFDKPVTMTELVEARKNSMLLEDNILKIGQNKVLNIFNDTKKKEKLFEEALLLERLYDIEIEKQRKLGVTEANKVPQKFRGIDPKHIRISDTPCETEQQYVRKKYVCRKRKLQYYNHARKIEQSSLKSKKKENLGVLEALMNHSSGIQQRQSRYFTKAQKINKQTNIFQQDLKIKRLFLKYSNHEAENPEEMYKYIDSPSMDQFFQDFGLVQKRDSNEVLLRYLKQKHQQSKRIEQKTSSLYSHSYSYSDSNQATKFYLFDFLQIIYILAQSWSPPNPNSTCNISPFLQQNIWPKQDKTVPQQWLKLKKIKKSMKMNKFMKSIRFYQKLDQLFERVVNKRRARLIDQPVIVFDDLLEIAWELKLFPTLVSKKVLRFFYLYSKSNQNGMNRVDFSDMMLVVGFKFSDEETVENQINWVINLLEAQPIKQSSYK